MQTCRTKSYTFLLCFKTRLVHHDHPKQRTYRRLFHHLGWRTFVEIGPFSPMSSFSSSYPLLLSKPLSSKPFNSSTINLAHFSSGSSTSVPSATLNEASMTNNDSAPTDDQQKAIEDSPLSSESTTTTSDSSLPVRPQDRLYKMSYGIDLKMPDREAESQFLSQQQLVRDEFEKSNYTKALEISKSLYTTMLGHYGTMYHPGVASTQSNIGLMHKSLGEYDLARQSYQKALSIYEKVVGNDHASYAATLHNLAIMNKAQVQIEQSKLKQQEAEEGENDEAGDESQTNSQRRTSPISAKEMDEVTKKHQELLDQAIDYLERAWRIREQELGSGHAKTTDSRSSLGSTLVYKMLIQHESMDRKTSSAKANSAKSTKFKRISVKQWEVAEDHLREALKTAMAKSSASSTNSDGRTSSTTTSDSSSSRLSQSGQPQVVVTTTPSSSIHSANTATNTTVSTAEAEASSFSSSSSESNISTLAAATAAQNLAVCLKYRATMMRDSPKKQKILLLQARELYQSALATRISLLGDEFHPQVTMSKHSLAECLDVMGEKTRANSLRLELIDAYERHKKKREKEAEQNETKTKNESDSSSNPNL